MIETYANNMLCLAEINVSGSIEYYHNLCKSEQIMVLTYLSQPINHTGTTDQILKVLVVDE